MKKFNTSLYKNMASILCCGNKEFQNAQNLVLISRCVQIYPSKSIYCLIINRIISYFERNVMDISLILDIMRDEGEDVEMIQTIEMLRKNPTIKSKAEVNRLCCILSDYVKYSKILKQKESFIQALDLIDDPDTGIKETVDCLYQISTKIQQAYNSVTTSELSHTFDTADVDGMRVVIAQAKDSRSSNKVIITGIRGLNNLLSPGYLSECIYVYAGLPGNYKSGMLLESHIDTCLFNEHILQTLNGKTPISMYISMENTMSQTIRRLWSILYPTSDMSMYTVDEIVEKINSVLSSKGFRSVILYYGYREKTTEDIANIIASYNTEETEVVALYFDYIKRVRPASKDPSATATEKGELNAIMNEFKSNICTRFGIPVITGHQLNRMAAAAVDQMVAHGGYNKSNEVLGRSQVGSAWEVVEVADWLGILNIENDGEAKSLMIKAVKQRDVDSSNSDVAITAISHPFLSPQSFALRQDILENVSLSTPLYTGKRQNNFIAQI